MKLFQKFKKKPKIEQNVMQTTCFDKVDYHYEKALEAYLTMHRKEAKELSDDEILEVQRYAGNHIGFFLAWIIQNHHEGELHVEDTEELEAVRNETMSGMDFLLECCDGKLWKDDMSEEIYPFVNDYYDQYLSDYTQWVLEELHDVPLEFAGSWEEYHDFEPVLDKAYADYQKRRNL